MVKVIQNNNLVIAGGVKINLTCVLIAVLLGNFVKIFPQWMITLRLNFVQLVS